MIGDNPTARLLLALACVLVLQHSRAAAAEPPAAKAVSRVDFSYAFATPHRLTLGRPDSSDRTLLDLQPGSLRMAWSYDDLTRYPLAAFKTPPTAWDIRITPQIDGHGMARSRWTRLQGWLPALENTYEEPAGTIQLQAVGGITAALVKIEITNRDAKPHQVVVRCDSASWGENPAWVDPSQGPGDNLVAGWNERADRVLVLGLGADAYSLQANGKAAGPKALLLVWNLKPHETRTGFVVRPYRAYAAELPTLRARDWSGEITEAIDEWSRLVARAAQVIIPDAGVTNAYRACLADLFIMREPVAGGYVAAVPGTEVYRAPNAFEAAVVAVAIDQVGLHQESAAGYRMCLKMQEPDGNWDDPKGWGHLMWGGAGFKAWAAMEHFRLTRDRRFLANLYPRLLANSRWQEQQRARTRVAGAKDRPVTCGLMPPGMGDCGLMDDGDLYGVFLPHNIWAVYADRLAVEAAEILGQTNDVEELRGIYETGRKDLLAAIDRGAIREKDFRWIPGVPGKTSGSRWGVLNALFPCHLLPADHELVTGSLRKIESALSPGGIPINTGWLRDGMWVAIALDNIAEAHLARGNGEAAARYLYATLNHGTPLYTWCEERGPEPASAKCTGDRQHLWTPVAVVRAIRDCLLMENGDGLHLALGADRQWLAGGAAVGIERGATHFGPVTFQMQYDKAGSRVTGNIEFLENRPCAWAQLHVRLPSKLRLIAVNPDSGAEILAGGETLQWKTPHGKLQFQATVGEAK